MCFPVMRLVVVGTWEASQRVRLVGIIWVGDEPRSGYDGTSGKCAVRSPRCKAPWRYLGKYGDGRMVVSTNIRLLGAQRMEKHVAHSVRWDYSCTET